LQTVYAFAWDPVKQAFAFGSLQHYKFHYRWKAYHPCDPGVAEDLLRYCSGNEAFATLFKDWTSAEVKTSLCCCAGGLVTIGMNASRSVAYGSLCGPAEMSISYYGPNGEVEALYLPKPMVETFVNNIRRKRRREIRVRLAA